MLEGSKVLVTGCAGFLGPWLCQELLSCGAELTGLDIHFPESSRIHELEGQINVLDLDIEDYPSLEKLILESEFNLVFHLAAQALVGEAMAAPKKTMETNVGGTVNVLEACRMSICRVEPGSAPSLKALIVASSDKAYGDHEILPYREEAPMQGRFPYDVSKSCADLIARSYFHSYGMPVCVTRCGNLYGGGDLNWSRIVPGTIASLLAGERPIIRSDGLLVRDYIYVEDAARAMVALARTLAENPLLAGEPFNISDDNPLSVLEIVSAIQKAVGGDELEPVIENSARGEIQAQYLDSAKLRELTGWTPRITLAEGLEKSVSWYKDLLHADSRADSVVNSSPL